MVITQLEGTRYIESRIPHVFFKITKDQIIFNIIVQCILETYATTLSLLHSIISLCTIIKEKKKPNSVDQYTFIFYSEKKKTVATRNVSVAFKLINIQRGWKRKWKQWDVGGRGGLFPWLGFRSGRNKWEPVEGSKGNNRKTSREKIVG